MQIQLWEAFIPHALMRTRTVEYLATPPYTHMHTHTFTLQCGASSGCITFEFSNVLVPAFDFILHTLTLVEVTTDTVYHMLCKLPHAGKVHKCFLDSKK